MRTPSDRWQRTEALFHAARARPPAERVAFLAEACSDDEAMRRDLEALLAEAASDDPFLDQPVRVNPQLLSDAAASVLIGRTLSTYRVDALLGVGGMGAVYRAYDTRLDRVVALKTLPAAFTANPERLARFEREARMLAALNHPNICSIYGVEEASGCKFLILEFVDGDTLAARIAATPPVSFSDALTISRQIAEALEAAHERGIVHRDLKPANICITSDGVVKVLDFGLAKSVGNQPSADLSNAAAGDTAEGRGLVFGTAAYMSPEQARGLSVDKRSDIWAFGCVLYELLSRHRAFGGDTASDSIAKILERDPDWSALPATVPEQLRRVLRRCLAKDPRTRLRDIGDARLEIEEICGLGVAEAPRASPARSRPWSRVALASALIMGTSVGLWQATRQGVADDPFASAQFSTLTDWDGTEALADISPDGRFVVFLSDRAGELDLWWTQVGTGEFRNLTENMPSLDLPGVLRTFGFSGDGAEVWFGAIGRPNMMMPQTGGAPRPFLAEDAKALAWSTDGNHVVYFTLSGDRDPLTIADRTGADARRIEITPSDTAEWSGVGDSRAHNHNPVWSPDKQWIYFVHGVVRDWNHPSDEMDIWRIRPEGSVPERLTRLNTGITFLAPIDARTLLFIAPGEDGSGSWLWSFDIGTRIARKVVSGLEQFTSVSVSRNGSRIVATRADPMASLWTVPILQREATDDDVRPYVVDIKQAHAPRFGGTALFYLSARGTGDGLWRANEGRSVEVHRAADGILLQAPAPSRDGLLVAVVRKRDNKHVLTVMSANGTNARTLAPTLEAHGTADWSPDGKWLVTGGIDANGQQGLFKIAAEESSLQPVKLADGEASNPVWSPDGETIVYAGPFARGQASLFARRPDGTRVDFPAVRVSPGGYRFLPDGTGLVYLPRPESVDLWLLELQSRKPIKPADFMSTVTRQLTRLGQRGTVRRFDITPDGKRILFDRVRQNSDVVLIDLQRR